MKKILFACVCSVALFATSAEALRFGTTPIVDIPMKKVEYFLSSHNDALEKAMNVHNLMTELPILETMFEQQGKLKAASKKMHKYFDNLMKCNEKRFGRFKNGKDVLQKVRTAYQDKTKDLHDDEGYYAEDSIVPRSIAERDYLWERKRDIEQEIMTDALTNSKKWGGQLTNKNMTDVPENMRLQMTGTGLEELMLAEDGIKNADVAEGDFDVAFTKMQQSFVNRLGSVGLSIPDFNAARAGDLVKVRKELQKLKEQYVQEAKDYIAKLDAQDAAHPRAVAKRASRTQNKAQVLSKVQDQFPEAFAEMQKFDQQTPQQQQLAIIAALEKDANGTVYLTETNALDVDQRMAESKSNQALVDLFAKDANKAFDTMLNSKEIDQDFDFSVCS